MGELQLLQNKAAKTILSLPSFSSIYRSIKYTWLVNTCETQVVSPLRFRFQICKWPCIDFNFDTKRNYDIHSYNTRGKTNFYLPRIILNYGKQRLLYQGLADWNKLNKSIRDIKSILLFKEALKNVVLS